MSDVLDELRIFITTQGFISEDQTLDQDTSLTETGVIDSIILLQLIDFIENKYRIEIPLNMITADNFDTLNDIHKTVNRLKMEKR